MFKPSDILGSKPKLDPFLKEGKKGWHGNWISSSNEDCKEFEPGYLYQVSSTFLETAKLVKGEQLSGENSLLLPIMLIINMYTSWHTLWTKSKLV